MKVKLKTRKLKEGRKSFYLDYSVNGIRQRDFLKIYTVPGDSNNREATRLADVIRANRELELYGNEHSIISPNKRKVDFLLYFAQFVNDYKKEDKRIFQASLHKFIEYSSETLKVSSLAFKTINKSMCEGYRDHLSHEVKLATETVHNYYARFKRVLNRAVDEGFLRVNSAISVKVRRPGSDLKKEVLTEEEITKLEGVKCGNDEVKRAFLFACYSGIGESEVKNLKAGHLRNGRLQIVRKKLEKKDIEIDIPLHEKAEQFLPNDWRNTKGNLFKLPSSTSVSKNLRTWMKKAKIDKHITFYCARHTFAVRILMHTSNVYAVKEALGHTSLSHTIKYLNHVSDVKDDAVLSLPS